MNFKLNNWSLRSCRLLINNVACSQSKPHLRTVTFLQNPVQKSVLLDKSHHKLIYDFPSIKLVAAVLRSKISVPVASVLFTPVCYVLDETHVSPFITLVSASCYFLLGTVVSKVADNMVGKIYVNKENEITEVLISSVNKYGRRIDRIHNVDDLINIDYPDKISRAFGFIAVGVENSDMYYKINKKSGKFLDESACDFVLGFQVYNMKKSNEDENYSKEVENMEKSLPQK